MSKKRKTRKQKESASTRLHSDLPKASTHVHIDTPTYSVSSLSGTSVETTRVAQKPANTSVAQKDAEYLKHDMVAITAASGIVAAFDVLLFALLATGFLHLNFLGY